MLTFWGNVQSRFCDGFSRRSFLKAGALGVGGLTLADLLRVQARAGTSTSRGKAIIMVYLNGGPSHIDLYDMKPEAPVEDRGEFKPIKTNVSGMHLCELRVSASQYQQWTHSQATSRPSRKCWTAWRKGSGWAGRLRA